MREMSMEVDSMQSRANIIVVENVERKRHLKVDKQISVRVGESATWKIAAGLGVTLAKVWFPCNGVTTGENPKTQEINTEGGTLEVVVSAAPGTYPYAIYCEGNWQNFEQGGHQMADGLHSHPVMIVTAT